MPEWTYSGDEEITTPTLAPFIAGGAVHWTPGETKTLAEDAPDLGLLFQRAGAAPASHGQPDPPPAAPEPEPEPPVALESLESQETPQ